MFSSIQGKNTFYIITILFFFLTILLFFNYILLRDFSLENAQRTSKLILESADSQLEIIFDEIEAIVRSMSTLRFGECGQLSQCPHGGEDYSSGSEW